MDYTQINEQSEKMLTLLLKRIKKVQTRLYADFVKEIKKLDTQNDKFTLTSDNIEMLTKLKLKLGVILKESGYDKAINEYITEYPKLLKKFTKSFTKLQSLTEMDLSILQALMETNLRELKTVGSIALENIWQNLYNSVLGGIPISDGVDLIRNTIVGTSASGGSLNKYAMTYARTSQGRFIQSSQDLSTKDVPKDKRLYEYVGPSDNVTRPECREGLSKRFFTESERSKFESKHGIRWNCRHVFVLVDQKE